jgi:RNA polymerase sigma-54 factor
LARRIADCHLEALGDGQYGKIATALGVDRTEVVAALEFIRAHLTPDPAAALGPATRPPPLEPDIAIRETHDGLAVEVLERGRLRLIVSPLYEQALATPRPAHEHDLIRRQLLAARAFIERLEQRWRTMVRVAEVAVGRQRAFILDGRPPVALTRAHVADELGLHESTVSRAVAGRSLLLPSGRVVAFARLFGRSHAPQEALAQLVAAETRPKSDAVLARELSGLGYALARRTVAKYREQLGILPSSLRRAEKPASHLTSV